MPTHFQPIKLFSERSHYSRQQRAQLSDLLRPYWKDDEFDDEKRRQMYGLTSQDFALSPTLAESDVAILPMTWNHYMERGEVSKVSDFISAARKSNRPVLSYVSGDEGVTVPPGFEDVWVVRASGYKSRRRKRQIAQPVFFDDPMERLSILAESEGKTDEVAAENLHQTGGSKGETSPRSLPLVGFCGQASATPLKIVMDVARVAWRNAAYHAGLRKQEPQTLYPPALLRARAIRTLQNSPLVRTDFIIRARYRAGATGAESFRKTSKEFYENMIRTDYTLCARGGGNFSKRIYETLAMGRIPLFIDTDCLLPLESAIAWDENILRSPCAEMAELPRRVAEHFSARTIEELAELKKACRALWESSLSFRGFHEKLIHHILKQEDNGAAAVFTSEAGKHRGNPVL